MESQPQNPEFRINPENSPMNIAVNSWTGPNKSGLPLATPFQNSLTFH